MGRVCQNINEQKRKKSLLYTQYVSKQNGRHHSQRGEREKKYDTDSNRIGYDFYHEKLALRTLLFISHGILSKNYLPG